MSPVIQNQCQLSWSMENTATNNIIFIVAGVDHSGMISMVESNMRNMELEMTEMMTEKYVEMIVIGVDSVGVVDMMTVEIKHQEQCQEQCQSWC